MSKCIYNLDGKYKDIENKLYSVLNESGELKEGDNQVIGPCDIGNKYGNNVKSYEKMSRNMINIRKSLDPINISKEEFYSEYRSLEDIYKRLENKNKNIEILNLEPKTVENNELKLFKLGNGRNKILITGGMHAREWLSIATVPYLIEILMEMEKKREFSNLFEDNEYFIIPVCNPDGYKYTYETNNRYWRKNKNGKGVDLNRNWEVGFGGASTSKNENSDIYIGEEPFSENETKCVKKVIDQEKFKIHLDIHSFSQMICASWSYTEKKHPRNKEFEQVGKVIKDSFPNTNYMYGHGSMNGLLGLCGGTVQDYSSNKDILGFTIELPPSSGGIESFNPDPKNIIPVGNDLVNVLKNISVNNLNRNIEIHEKEEKKK
jgi:hypothetical protein